MTTEQAPRCEECNLLLDEPASATCPTPTVHSMSAPAQLQGRRTYNGDWIDRWVVVAVGKGGLVRVIGTPAGNPFATSEAAGKTADAMGNDWERVEVVPFTAEP